MNPPLRHREVKLEWGQRAQTPAVTGGTQTHRKCCCSLIPLLALISHYCLICLELSLFVHRADQGTRSHRVFHCLDRLGQHPQDHVPRALRAADRHEGWSGSGLCLLRQVLHWGFPEPLQTENWGLQWHFRYSLIASKDFGKSCDWLVQDCKGNPNMKSRLSRDKQDKHP